MIDIAIINCYILFQIHCQNNPNNNQLKRPVKYNLQNFREEVVRNLAGFPEYGNPDLGQRKNPTVEPSIYETVHMPMFSDPKRN